MGSGEMEQGKPIISVIVPVYNVEPYVERCLKSITEQTYPNLEIIVVDDASTDRGGSICDICAAGDERIQVIHFPENKGLSAARNEGVRMATGAFISFVDSDDYAEPKMLELLYDNLREKEADISICGTKGLRGRSSSSGVYSRADAAACLARRAPFLWNAWGKLYPAELVKHVPFDRRALCCEDLVFFYQILKHTGRISYLPEQLYHYTHRENSIINSPINEKRCTVLSALDEICEDAAADFSDLEMGFRQIAMDTSVRLAMQTIEGDMAGRQVFEYLTRFQRSIQRHFHWKALVLSPGKKDVLAELLLYASTAVFWQTAVIYRWVKRMGLKRRSERV